MEFKRTNHNRDRGFTLVEMMVAVAVGCLLLAALATLYVFSMRSFGAMANYSDLNNKSRYASDIVSRDIRSALNVLSATPTPAAATQIVLKEPDDTTGNTTYKYDDVNGTLSRTKNGETKILLTGVNSMTFTLYQRPFVNPLVTPVYEDIKTAALTSDAKLVAFQWSCSRRLVGSLDNSESLEAAMVEIRNK
jgi:prepilin-type N-terminal cleavage/methylation domain-containing protein